MPSSSLQRICLAQDGRLKANFSDNSIMVLNSSGSGFVHLTSGDLSDPHASPAVAQHPSEHDAPEPCTGALSGPPRISRQLSEYALSRHLPQLRVALEFRNMHVDQPFFCQPLLRKQPRPQVGAGTQLHVPKSPWYYRNRQIPCVTTLHVQGHTINQGASVGATLASKWPWIES